MPRCPNGHESDAADFCSVCGAEMVGMVTAPLPVPAVCPVCTTPRDSAAQAVCEVCGYDFRTGRSGIPRPAAAGPAPSVGTRWDVVVEVDANLYGKPSPEAPVGHPPQTFTLFETESLVGRAAPGVRAHVPLSHDPGVSRRHAVFVRQPDGGLVVRDLNSANGTQLNGQELLAGVDNPVRDGDVLAVGAWTRITVREVRPPE